ncbi:TPA: SDR family oxidoreductase [Escherichia coli]|nr:SDR family oxidoreductase [Escherichia coli]
MILSAFSLEGKVAVVTGCDTGLGQGMALGLAQAGCDIVGINIVEPTETIKQVTALGRRFLSLTADLRKIDGIPALLDRAVAEFGHIDILVNNAGLIRREDALEFSEKDWDDVMNLNIKSVFFMSQAAAKHNINVNAIAPGYMATNNTQQLRADEQRSAEILDRIPAGRWGLPSDLMGPVVFLASSASDYVNGYTIAVDGGWLAR